jgi:iron complex outermembrane recepter protein
MKLRRYLLGGSILALPFYATAGYAADAQSAAASDEMTEIVVSAQRREESLQRVPLSVQALTSETLQEKQVVALDDYVKLVPSVTVTSLGPGRSSVYFRGIATGAGGPTSGAYFDETPIQSGGRSLDPHVYDVSRVEALSGPQGTLFGAAAMGGVVRIITNKPDPTKFSGGVDVQANKYGPGDAGGMFEGFVNVPVADNAAVRVVGFYQKLGGFVDNEPATVTYQLGDNDPNTRFVKNNAAFVKDDVNKQTKWGARIAGMIDLNDDWTVNVMSMYQNIDAYGNTLFVPRHGDLVIHEFDLARNRDKWLMNTLTIEGRVGILDIVYSGSYMGRQTSTINDYTYYSVYYDSVPGYTNFPLANGTFLDPTQKYRQSGRRSNHTQEIRASTDAANRFRLTAGAFYQKQTSDGKADYYNPGLDTIVNVATHVPRPVYFDAMYLVYSDTADKDRAVFAEAAFDITDTLTVTGGVRYFGYDRKSKGFSGIFRAAIRVNCPVPIPFPMSCVNQDFSAKGDGETHKVNAQWQVTPDKMVYATYSTGYRPGGFNTAVGVRPYDSDTLTNYELGYKTTWNGVLRLNGAVYYDKWDGMQFSVVIPGQNGRRGTYNAGSARVYGTEADITWLVTDELTLSGSASYNDAALAKDLCNLAPDANLLPSCTPGPTTVSTKGVRLPFQPKFKMSATARYEVPVGEWDGFLQGSFNYQTDSTNDIRAFASAIYGPNPSFKTFDFSVGAKKDMTSVEFFIQNAFDGRGVISKSAFCAIEICPNTVLHLPIKPQFFGVKVSQRFE